jgi:hypothetical protein
VSLRPRRALVGLITAVAALALPAAASAAESLSFTLVPGAQAGSNPQITAKLGFAPGAGDNPKTVVLSLAPGIAANLNANQSCITGSPQLTGTACLVGTATVSYSVAGTAQPDATGGVYLVPPQASSDFAGLETVITNPAGTFPNQYTGASLRTTPTVGVDLTTTFGTVPAPLQITGFSNTLNPTLNNIPFTALPTSCPPSTTSTMSVTYQGTGGTPAGSANGSFSVTGCANLKYAPKLTAAVTRDKSDSGAAVTLTQTQTVGESSSKTIVFSLPKGLSPNVLADAPCLTGGAGCQIGTAVATSPGVPNAALANGIVTLKGSVSAPVIAVSFPAPFGLTETGNVNLANGTVTFADVPDLPLTSLALKVTGPNGQKAFNTDCVPASIGGQFTAQSGATATVSAPIAFTGCPTASGSTSGLAGGSPKLKFNVANGKGGNNLTSVAIGVPAGLKFSSSAISRQKTCTGTGKQQKCSIKTLIKGLGVSGAKVKSAAIVGGKLVITFKKAAAKATITVSGPLVTETTDLQKKVKKHKVKTLTFSLRITDAKSVATTLSLKLKAH